MKLFLKKVWEEIWGCFLDVIVFIFIAILFFILYWFSYFVIPKSAVMP